MPDQTEVIDNLPAADEAADEAQFEAAYAEIAGKAAPQEAVTEGPEAEAAPANATDTLDASAADKAAQDEAVTAARFVLMAVEFARYALEDYAHRPDVAALLDALAAYHAADAARETATAALTAAEKELDR